MDKLAVVCETEDDDLDGGEVAMTSRLAVVEGGEDAMGTGTEERVGVVVVLWLPTDVAEEAMLAGRPPPYTVDFSLELADTEEDPRSIDVDWREVRREEERVGWAAVNGSVTNTIKKGNLGRRPTEVRVDALQLQFDIRACKDIMRKRLKALVWNRLNDANSETDRLLQADEPLQPPPPNQPRLPGRKCLTKDVQ